jgi:hypothetical protein
MVTFAQATALARATRHPILDDAVGTALTAQQPIL